MKKKVLYLAVLLCISVFRCDGMEFMRNTLRYFTGSDPDREEDIEDGRGGDRRTHRREDKRRANEEPPIDYFVAMMDTNKKPWPSSSLVFREDEARETLGALSSTQYSMLCHANQSRGNNCEMKIMLHLMMDLQRDSKEQLSLLKEQHLRETKQLKKEKRNVKVITAFLTLFFGGVCTVATTYVTKYMDQ